MPASRCGPTACTSVMIFSTGAASTTRLAPRTASSGDSQTPSHHGWSRSRTRFSGLRDQRTMRRARPRRRTALATEPPSNPGARMVSCSNILPTKAIALPVVEPRACQSLQEWRSHFALSCPRRCGRMLFMDDATEQKDRARRAIIVLCSLMALGILLPLVLWWFKR